MKLLFTAFAFLSGLIGLSAQQLPLFTQYREYAGILNPASIPHDYLWYECNLSFALSHRKQWINNVDGPSTQVLRGDYLWLRDNVHPIMGGYLLNDQAGRALTTGAYTRMGMLFSDSPLEYGFSAALSVGAARYGLNLIGGQVRDPSDPMLAEAHSKIFPDVGLGIFGYTTLGNKLLYGGLSVPQVLGFNLNFRGRDSKENITFRRVQHFYANGGIKISLQDDYSFIECSTWVRYISGLPPSFDANFRYQISEFFFLGAGMSSTKVAHLDTGVLFGEERKIRISIGADLPFTPTSAYFGSAIEATCVLSLQR
jgi:type IX secretion system PorP/SprF family membrane protein